MVVGARAMVVSLSSDWRCWGHGDIERLHLLTTTAAPFFHVLDYAITDRASTPASIAASAEFTTLCPANATYMTKGLVDAAARLS